MEKSVTLELHSELDDAINFLRNASPENIGMSDEEVIARAVYFAASVQAVQVVGAVDADEAVSLPTPKNRRH